MAERVVVAPPLLGQPGEAAVQVRAEVEVAADRVEQPLRLAEMLVSLVQLPGASVAAAEAEKYVRLPGCVTAAASGGQTGSQCGDLVLPVSLAPQERGQGPGELPTVSVQAHVGGQAHSGQQGGALVVQPAQRVVGGH